jgi:hypothetical protein
MMGLSGYEQQMQNPGGFASSKTWGEGVSQADATAGAGTNPNSFQPGGGINPPPNPLGNAFSRQGATGPWNGMRGDIPGQWTPSQGAAGNVGAGIGQGFPPGGYRLGSAAQATGGTAQGYSPTGTGAAANVGGTATTSSSGATPGGFDLARAMQAWQGMDPSSQAGVYSSLTGWGADTPQGRLRSQMEASRGGLSNFQQWFNPLQGGDRPSQYNPLSGLLSGSGGNAYVDPGTFGFDQGYRDNLMAQTLRGTGMTPQQYYQSTLQQAPVPPWQANSPILPPWVRG